MRRAHLLMTSRVVVMVDVTAVVWATGVLVTDTSPKYSFLLRYSTCGSSAHHKTDDTTARQKYMLDLWTRLAKWTFEMLDTTHAINAYKSHDMSEDMRVSWLASLS